jgi:hypothetical protein
LPDWPAALTWDEALEYTRVGEEQMRKWVRARVVVFRASGFNGARIAQRTQLDAALADLFKVTANDLSEDMDFGDGD